MTTTPQTEASRLVEMADELERVCHDWTIAHIASAELRRLDSENQRQRADLERKSEAIQRLWAERDQLRAQVDQMQGGEPVTLTDGLIERGALTGMVDAQIDSSIAALREKEQAK